MERTVDPLSVVVDNLLDQTLRLKESDGRSSERTVDLNRAEEERNDQYGLEGRNERPESDPSGRGKSRTYLHSVDEDRLAERRRWKDRKEDELSFKSDSPSRFRVFLEI